MNDEYLARFPSDLDAREMMSIAICKPMQFGLSLAEWR